MTILTIRTDKPDAEIGLYDEGGQVDYDIWQAHRQLAETLHGRIDQLLTRNSLTLQDLTGIVCYSGPGSFTGLRIGLTVANAFAGSLSIPISGQTGEDWIAVGLKALADGQGSVACLPEYGADVHITTPKH